MNDLNEDQRILNELCLPEELAPTESSTELSTEPSTESSTEQSAALIEESIALTEEPTTLATPTDPNTSNIKAKKKSPKNKKPKIGDTFTLELEKIIVEAQVRKTFDEDKLLEFAKQIKQEGQRLPLEVSKIGTNKYLLITGERRLRALKINQAPSARVTLIEVPEGIHNRISFQLTENLQRDDLTALELAEAFDKLKSIGWSQKKIAKKIGKTAGWVSRYINLIGIPSHLSSLLENNHTSDTQLIGILRKIDELSPRLAQELAKKVAEGNTSRQMVSDSYEALKLQLGKSTDPSADATEDTNQDASDSLMSGLNTLHHNKKHMLIKPNNFRARVEARLADGKKVVGQLLIDRLTDSQEGIDEGWCWIVLEDGEVLCIQTDKIKITSVFSV